MRCVFVFTHSGHIDRPGKRIFVHYVGRHDRSDKTTLASLLRLDTPEGRIGDGYPLSSFILESDDPAAEYAQMIHVERERFPSLDIVPAAPEIYSAGLRRNENLVGSEIEQLQSRLQELGALAQILGHENLNTTARYTKRTQDQLGAAADRMSY